MLDNHHWLSYKPITSTRNSEKVSDSGRAGVVRNGYLPERELHTGIGPVKVRIPKVRSRTGV
ncbi:MAG: putative transposase, partial [Parvicella sp.]